MGGKLRRILSVSLGLSLLFSSLGFASAAASSPIKDYEGHWAQQQIESWLEKGLLKGFEDGSVKPNQSITRAEFVALVNRVFEITKSQPVKFTDLPATGWVYEEFSKAVTQGYIKGYGDKVRPNAPVTRQEVAAIISKLLFLEEPNNLDVLDQFKDRDQISAWSERKVAAMINSGTMKGYPSGNFAPTQALTRAEAVAILESLNAPMGGGFLITQSGVFGSKDPAQLTGYNSLTVSTYGVNLQNAVIHGDLLLDEGIGEGEVSLDNVTVKGKVIVKGGGVNSIHFKNSTIEQVVVQRKSGVVRLVTEGTTQIKNIFVQTGAILNLGEGTTVSKVILDALTKVIGQGQLLSVTVNDRAKGSSFEKKPDLVEGSQKDSITMPTPTVAPTVGAAVGGSSGGGGGNGSSGGETPTTTPIPTPTTTPTPSPVVNVPLVNEITLVQEAVYKYTNAATITVNLSKVSHALRTQAEHAEYYFTTALEGSPDLDKAQGWFPIDMFVSFPIYPDHIKDYMTIILTDEDSAPIGYKSIKLDLNAKYTTLDMSTVTKYSEGVNITGASISHYINNSISLDSVFVQQHPEVKYFTTTPNTAFYEIVGPNKGFNVEHISSTVAYLNEISESYSAVEISYESFDYDESPFYTQPNFEEEYMVILYDSELKVLGYYQGKANLTDQQKADNVGFKIGKLPAVDLLVLNDEAAVNWVYDRYFKLTDDQKKLIAGDLIIKIVELKEKLLLLKQG
ncbi:S-layer homology domain-containing protein [Paenibacillus sp. FSL R10-2734]|uniref:S-layer homology domain-containing protein n=1 Tax=Paenibacillus sp. FSL R10-2734 TaxID=2954691 RepID=UPI0030D7D7CA